MEYKFTLTINDYVNADNIRDKVRPFKFITNFIFSILVVPIAAIFVIVYAVKNAGINELLLCVLLVVGGCIFNYLIGPKLIYKKKKQVIGKILKKKNYLIREQSIIIKDNYIFVKYENKKIKVQLNNVKKIVEKNGLICIYGYKYEAYAIVPCYIFKNDIEKDEFIKKVYRK